jgi:nicotinamide mononucleotide (NMN) deamidase PncC
VGTVWVAVSGPDRTTAQCYLFDGTRGEIMSAAVEAAIGMLGELLG